MKGRPILFSAPMIRAILAGRKTQTRRVVAPSNSTVLGYAAKPFWPGLLFEHAEVRGGSIYGACDLNLSVPFRHPDDAAMDPEDCGQYRVRPKWQTGGRLRVKESAYITPKNWADAPTDCNRKDADGDPRIVGYAASMCSESVRCAEDYKIKLSPSIFMPRWASRLTLEIVSVRVQRVRDIVYDDACAEGVEDCTEPKCPGDCGAAVNNFRNLWDGINEARGFGWNVNPWVWAVEFRVINPKEAQP